MLLLSRFTISGHSMKPALKEGDSVLVSILPYLFTSPKIGDIIACCKAHSKSILIKRIKKIEGMQYFVQGDNLQDSLDSRKFGMIEKKSILGKIVFII